ncbi:uncharacterized protein [Centruroides vittatus]|uniref:uncharacterized protein n=1 Tax=Centruroides vittatus TaxID=120091 RepID=UPI00350F4D30
MRELSAGKITEEFLRNLWLQRLPKNIQTVLAVSGDELDKLAILADKVAELTEPTQLASINLEADNPVIKNLEMQILELTMKVAELNVSRTARPRYRSRERNRHDPNSRYRISSRPRGRSLNRQGYCYYHDKFGSAARKCRSPCSFDRTALRSGKRAQPAAVTACGSSLAPKYSRLFVYDNKTGLNFLIDSGADLSIIPNRTKNQPTKVELYAANDSKISTYGTNVLELDLNLRRSFRWEFTIADVQKPIINADFLANFGLNLDIRNRLLVDPLTYNAIWAI